MVGSLTPETLLAVLVGLALGYGIGRYLWAQRRLMLSLWPIIAVIAVLAVITSRIFLALGLADFWEAAFFPGLVGLGAGLSITPARPPRKSAWWEIWKG